jgi:hypothetical protein
MTFEELNLKLQKLVGQTVSFKRLAGNALIIYFFGEPSDDTVESIFIETSWRLEKSNKVVVGSYDLQENEDEFETKEEIEQAFRQRAALTQSLIGATLQSFSVDSISSDITLVFSGEQIVRSFANTAFDDLCWTYRNHPEKLTVYASTLGLEAETDEDE